jgi:hypothetical protein
MNHALNRQCPCGHPAYKHTELRQHAAMWRRNPHQRMYCQGVEFALGVPHCHCHATREEVMEQA